MPLATSSMLPAVTSFLESVQKSNLIPTIEFQQVAAKFNAQADKLTDPTMVAGLLVKHGLLSTWQAKVILRGKAPNFRLKDKYLILDHLGTGGMSSVYLCEHLRLKQLVALKLFETNNADQATIQRFEREARVIFSLNHPNIVRAFDFDNDGKYQYIVMEFVDGINLHSLIERQGPLPVDIACNYILQAAEGLQHASQEGLVHRDVKPGNLLLHRSGVVKVLDLGLARSQQHKDAVTQQYDKNAVLGTVDYMAPEQALGGQVDTRADIYSLGVTLYYLLTGQVPFKEGTTAQKLLAHQIAEPVPVEEFRRDLPEALARLIRSMLKKNPDNRPSLPLTIAQHLQAWASPIMMPSAHLMPTYSARVQKLLNLAVDPTQSTISHVALNMPRTAKVTPISGRTRIGSTSTTGIVRPLSSRPPSEVSLTVELAQELASPTTSQTRRTTALSTIVRRKVSPKIIGMAVLSTVLVACGLYYVLRSLSAPAIVQERPSLIKMPIQVSKRSLPANPSQVVCSTVAEALRQARPGDQIIIMDDLWSEQLHETSLRLQQVTITSGTDKPVRWVAPANLKPSAPLVSLQDANGLTIRNIHFDGEGNIDTLLRLEGGCARVECTKLVFKGARHVAVQLVNVHSLLGDAPLTFDQCVFLADDKSSPMAFLTESPEAHGECSSVQISGCIFRGRFQTILGAEATLKDVVFENNRVSGADSLVSRGDAATATMKAVHVRSNNLHMIQKLFAFNKLPADSERLEFKGNLLIQVKQLVNGQQDSQVATSLPWLHASDNYGDTESLTDSRGGPYSPKTVSIPRVNTDTPFADDFLFLPKNSTLTSVRTSEGKRIGALQP